jgi:Stress responsive A/B Barrel Domain
LAIKHIVLVKFTEAANPAVVADLSKSFAALPSLIPGISAFEAGENVSPEGLNHGFTHAFVMTFVDTTARDNYLPHAAHQAFVERLKPYLADVLVVDYELVAS